MPDVSIVSPTGGEIMRMPGSIEIRLLEDGRTTSHRLAVAEITIPPRTDGPAQHRHARHDEGFYVVTGAARFTVGDQSYDAPPGTLVMVPPGAPHTFANPSDGTTVLLNTFTPDLYLPYFRDLQDLFGSGELTPAAAAATMARYATEPATDHLPNVTVTGVGPVPVTLTDHGSGPTILLLHGGAGPQSVLEFAGRLTNAGLRVITPVHPGFEGTLRPDGLDTVRDLGRLYCGLFDELDLSDVTVIGNSIGGWIAAEIGAVGSPRLGRLVLVDAVGLDVPGHPPVDFFSLRLDQVADYSYHNPDAFRIDPSTLPPERQAVMAGNRQALARYGGTTMTDPTLADRLARIAVPTLVIWGDSDRIADAEVGRAFAGSIPRARFELLTETGHLPQIESPERLLQVLLPFVRG